MCRFSTGIKRFLRFKILTSNIINQLEELDFKLKSVSIEIWCLRLIKLSVEIVDQQMKLRSRKSREC
ncbi:hypothetical protein BpHYR1_034552 [Brachionus plicatilis]|uniref:Uncharacterized protein n=1 Tax=Brachionus plicatilis TaxID=10195 RepID=A0A3M7R0M6_BRAPC|nr:hypothetical protein BpHYR1_034552 [Brachionus plicatilis]